MEPTTLGASAAQAGITGVSGLLGALFSAGARRREQKKQLEFEAGQQEIQGQVKAQEQRDALRQNALANILSGARASLVG